jgi:hypothetical protein
MAKVGNWQLGREMSYPYEARYPQDETLLLNSFVPKYWEAGR